MLSNTGLDRIIDKMPYADYQELINDLALLNAPVANSSVNSIYNPMDTSYAAANRSDKEKVGQNKTIRKTKAYGVVLAVIKNDGWFTGHTIYVDVPPYNQKIISHPDDFKTTPEFLEDFEDLIFEYDGLDVFSGIEARMLVEVQVPENYPNHIYNNKADALITGAFKKLQAVNGRTDKKQIESESSNGLNVQNKKNGLTYGEADIEYSWALTKTGKVPTNLSATELREIKKTKSAFDRIIADKRMDPYDKIIISVSKEFEINPVITRSIIGIESEFNANISSPTGAGGLMQITIPGAYGQAIKDGVIPKNTPATVAKRDPNLNVRAGVNGFKFYYKKFDGNILKAAGAYNNGDGKFTIKKTGEVRDNSGIKTWNFDKITVEATNYIFRFNAMLNFMSEHFKAPVSLGA